MALPADETRDPDRLMPQVYDELRRLAAFQLRRERPDHTLQPTALVHEAYLKLADQRDADWRDRAHFLAVAAEAIRRVLIDHARTNRAEKRGAGWQRTTISGVEDLPELSTVDFEMLHDALERLRALHERHYEVVKLRFFGGLTGEEIAHVLGVSRVTVTTDWTTAKAWLLSELDESAAS